MGAIVLTLVFLPTVVASRLSEECSLLASRRPLLARHRAPGMNATYSLALPPKIRTIISPASCLETSFEGVPSEVGFWGVPSGVPTKHRGPLEDPEGSEMEDTG